MQAGTAHREPLVTTKQLIIADSPPMLPGTSGHLPQHSDVLLADTPAAPEELAKLIEELKRRGNFAFKAGSFLEAEMLYGRAIEHDGTQAALWGNRCAARLGMKKYAEALADADAAIKAQPDWAKGHFRRGQCLAGLLRWTDAKLSFQRTLELEPTNADAKREMAKAETEAQRKSSAPVPAAAAAPAAPVPAKTKAKASSSSSSSAPTPASDAKADDDAEQGEVFRGYKKLDDGRTTTFFHREIPAEEKAKLAATSVPKKVDAAQAAPVAVDKNGSSAWNAAGTFEERDMTAWAKERITAMVKGTTTIFEEGEGVVEATGVSEIDGGASVSFIRGNKRFPFDFTFAVDWSAEVDDKTVTGKLFYTEFTSESSDMEAEVRWPDREKAGGKAASLLKHIKGPLKQAVDERLRAWVLELRLQ